jgi:hypothetical protein
VQQENNCFSLPYKHTDRKKNVISSTSISVEYIKLPKC